MNSPLPYKIPLPTVEQVQAELQAAGIDTSQYTIHVSRCQDTAKPLVSLRPITIVHQIECTISVSSEDAPVDENHLGKHF